MLQKIIIFFSITLSVNAFAIHTFSCGIYRVNGTLETNKDRGHALVISEGSYSETVMYPSISPELKAQLPALPHRGYFTIKVESKETIKDHVTLVSLMIEENPLASKQDVQELQQTPCTVSMKTPEIVKASYPAAPKKPYKAKSYRLH